MGGGVGPLNALDAASLEWEGLTAKVGSAMPACRCVCIYDLKESSAIRTQIPTPAGQGPCSHGLCASCSWNRHMAGCLPRAGQLLLCNELKLMESNHNLLSKTCPGSCTASTDSRVPKQLHQRFCLCSCCLSWEADPCCFLVCHLPRIVSKVQVFVLR